jgi:Cu2+-exporting ATPase
VLGGSINLESALRIEVRAVAAESFAGHLAQLVNAAVQARPAGVELSQRAARWFVAAVLLVSVGTALFWWHHDATRWFSTTLAVLVVSCPCALAIAVPAALAAAHSSLLGEGIAVLDGRALERLAAVSHCLFDKTGTLTVGQLTVREVECMDDIARETVLGLAGALAQSSNHPIARALRAAPGAASGLRAEDCMSVTGAGMSGRVAGAPIALGSTAYMHSLGIDVPRAATPSTTPGKEAWLARDGRLLARFEFDDRLRDDAPTLFIWLHEHRYATAIVSGDRPSVVATLAQACGVERFHAACTPADKSAEVAALQRAGAVVLMVGDGVNDAPVLAQADVSIAVADSAASARQQASVLLLTPQLLAIPRLLTVARRARQVMRENLCWAVLYNVIALPLAAAGWLAPWAAALGMSLSSLVVVLNALRLVRR